jgi:hypothetical protein
MIERVLAYFGALLVLIAAPELMLFELFLENSCHSLVVTHAEFSCAVIAQSLLGILLCCISSYFPAKTKRTSK